MFIGKENDRSKRFDYLLKQTEIFSHFMTNTNKDKSASPVKKAGRPRKDRGETGKPAGAANGDPGE